MFCSRFKYGILTFKLHNSLITDYENMRMSYDFFSGIILFILRFFFFLVQFSFFLPTFPHGPVFLYPVYV